MTANNPVDFIECVRRGEFVLMDGAMGTELERRGVPIEGSGWSALALRDHAEVIREIHEDYIKAGARLHIINSFALARHVLEPLGLGHEFENLNRRAMALFNDAVTRLGVKRNALWAAGSLSTFAAGIGLPLILGVTCDWGQGEGFSVTTARGMGGPVSPLEEMLPQVIAAAESHDVILSIMHSEADVTDAALEILHRYWDGPVAVYPNSGRFVDLRMQFDTVCDVAEFQQSAQRWIDAGIQIIGGCCGIGPAHIQGLARAPQAQI